MNFNIKTKSFNDNKELLTSIKAANKTFVGSRIIGRQKV